MRTPTMHSRVERRLLVNYRIDPERVRTLLPEPLEPQLVHGYAVGGICLIRLGALRPRGLPAALGTTSENAAHRIAVQWHEGSQLRTGVFIAARHTSALVNVAVGGRLFPGVHRRADFTVDESATEIAVSFAARDGGCSIDAAVVRADRLAESALFACTEDASRFFQGGAVGFSPARDHRRLDGLEFRTPAWKIEPTTISHVRSSMFDDRVRFPLGSIELDSALVMLDVPAEWRQIDVMPVMQPVPVGA